MKSNRTYAHTCTQASQGKTALLSVNPQQGRGEYTEGSIKVRLGDANEYLLWLTNNRTWSSDMIFVQGYVSKLQNCVTVGFLVPFLLSLSGFLETWQHQDCDSVGSRRKSKCPRASWIQRMVTWQKLLLLIIVSVQHRLRDSAVAQKLFVTNIDKNFNWIFLFSHSVPWKMSSMMRHLSSVNDVAFNRRLR